MGRGTAARCNDPSGLGRADRTHSGCRDAGTGVRRAGRPRDAEGGWVLDETATDRRRVCKSGNPWGLPAKDRSGRLDLTELPDLGALLARIDGRAPHQSVFAS